MILELISGISVGLAMLNGGALYLLYRRYISLAADSVEFAGIIMESIREQENGDLIVNPVSLVGVSMDHLDRMRGIMKWIRR